MSHLKCNTTEITPGGYLLPGMAAVILLWATPLAAERLDDTSIYTRSPACGISQVSAPAVTLNTYNKLQHRDDMYYAVFQPSASARWSGNIKKYRISATGDIFDSDAESAIDDATGQFAESSRSFWSEHPDGNDISRGGFRDKLPATRTVYTTDTTGTTPLNPADVEAVDLGLPPSDTNTGYTAEDEAVADRLVDWALGKDVFDNHAGEGNRFVADSLHAQPVVVNYGCVNPEADGSCLPDNLDDTLYGATNLGFLHAVDARSGNEKFSFIPRELLKNLPAYAGHAPAEPGKLYGLDGTLTVLRSENPEDVDQNIEPEDGDSVLVYSGMRRGGSSYHALDVTDRDSPRHLWQIDGPTITNKFMYTDTDTLLQLADTGDTGFEDLGQTWSAPRLSSINWDCAADGTACTHRTVLVFTGGYDSRHDENSLSSASDPVLIDEFGNAVYIVDAFTGTLLWSAGNNEDTRYQRNHDLHLPMTHSIVASPGLTDTDGDGAIDIVFAIDIAGAVWRIDINDQSRSATDFASGGMIFNLEEKGQFRRFYNRPDVVVNTPRGAPAFATLILGSGYRADPANDAQHDQVYVLFEDSVFAVPDDDDKDGDPYNEGLVHGDQLYQSRAQDELGQPVAPPQRERNAPNGYIIPLNVPGEKVLQPTLTLNNVAVVTSYVPANYEDDPPSHETCVDKPLGTGRVYLIDIHSGQTALDTEFIDLEYSGIPAKPTLVFSGSPGGSTIPVICVGTECFGQGDAPSDALGTIDIAHRSYWRENYDEAEPDKQ
jgi:type IV pilus assembly protein PilY1